MKNAYKIEGDVTIIQVKHRNELASIKIDTPDFETVAAIKGYWRLDGTAGRVPRVLTSKWNTQGKVENTYLKRILFNDAISGTFITHLNGDWLDYRRCNLKVHTDPYNRRNPYTIKDSTVYLEMKYKGKSLYCLLDEEDLPKIEMYRVYPLHKAHTTYAITNRIGGGRTINVTHIILDVPRGYVVDHINGDGLDNRKNNLRIVTQAQNTQNLKGAAKSNASGTLGVYKTARKNKPWSAMCTHDGISYHLGKYDSKEEASVAVTEFRKAYKPFSREARESFLSRSA